MVAPDDSATPPPDVGLPGLAAVAAALVAYALGVWAPGWLRSLWVAGAAVTAFVAVDRLRRG